MSRFERLLDLLQLLRRHRRPVSGRVLAEALGISLRTLYRDIASLQAQGAMIEGEAGLGYQLKPGFLLPPLMFGEDEIEALVLGARLVARRGDPALAAAATQALARIAAVLPAAASDSLAHAPLLAGPPHPPPAAGADPLALRRAIRRQCKLIIEYRDGSGQISRRTIWPCALGYFDDLHMLVAWCEWRSAFRHFRADRISALTETDQPCPRRRQVLLAEWQKQSGISADP